MSLFLTVPMFTVVPLSNAGQISGHSLVRPASNNRRRRRKLAKQQQEARPSSVESSPDMVEVESTDSDFLHQPRQSRLCLNAG